MEYTHISINVEADGPVPGRYSMRSLAAVVFTPKERIVSEFARNLRRLANASLRDATMKWWSERPDARDRAREDARDPANVILEFLRFLASFDPTYESLVCVSGYVGFDLQFVRRYTVTFAEVNPFWTRQLDLISCASAITKLPQPSHARRNLLDRWIAGSRHDHTAAADARSHASLAITMVSENRQRNFEALR